MDHLVAIILAAGYSSRMGAFKPLLPLGGTTLLERAVSLFRGAGIQDIRVVTGHRSDDLLPLLKRLQVRPLLNENYQAGMFSSVTAAATSIVSGNGAFFLLPVDIPLVRRETVELLARSYSDSSSCIIYPAFRGERGHPPLISDSYRDGILSWSGEGGLKAFLMQHEEYSLTLETDDDGILLDMDTEEDYERLQKRLRESSIPSTFTCEKILLERFAAGSPVVEHCRAVAHLARLLAEHLSGKECHLDLPLIEAAAMLHDMAKGEPDHAAVAAALLEKMGYKDVADLVALHMDLPPRSGETIEAADLLFLADKLMEGTRFVPLEIRFNCQMERHKGTPHILPNIIQRFENARDIQQKVELHLGFPISSIVADARI